MWCCAAHPTRGRENFKIYLYQTRTERVPCPFTSTLHIAYTIPGTNAATGELEQIRTVAPEIPLLIPGIGTQGGDLGNTIRAARRRFLINSSSGIMFASRDPAKFARAAGDEARKLQGDIQALLYTMER